jgi:hypothetical protein
MMEISGEMDRLARRLSSVTREGANPPLLFLGSACARAANVPTVDEVVQQMADSLQGTVDLPRIRTLAEHLIGSELPAADLATLPDLATDPNLAEKLYDRFVDLPASQRARLLLQVYDAIPIPLFYQDLTALLWAGYFTEILTTNVDTLLEQALNLGGFRPDYNYQVISLGKGTNPDDGWDSGSPSSRFVRIFKLHGDLAQQQVHITPEQITAALEPQRMLVKGELRGEIVMVGYTFESPPIDHWLTLTRGEVWWVSEEPPDPARIAPIILERPVNQITGPAASPSEFFGVLEATLLEPTTSGPLTVAEIADPGDVSFATAPQMDKQVDLLRTRISRSQTVLYNLEQQVAPSERDLPVQQQIDYQRGQLVMLEDKLRELPPSSEQVTSLIRQVVEAAEQAGVDERTLSFVRGQLATVEGEQGSDQANQHVVAAAIGATVVVAERLGPDVVRSDLVQQLAAYVPSVSTWR